MNVGLLDHCWTPRRAGMQNNQESCISLSLTWGFVSGAPRHRHRVQQSNMVQHAEKVQQLEATMTARSRAIETHLDEIIAAAAAVRVLIAEPTDELATEQHRDPLQRSTP